MSLCSVAAVLLREHDGRATAEIVCAGHPLPLLASDGHVRPVGAFSPMLGAQPVEDWSRRTVELDPGDVLVLYTDGVFDAVGDDGRFGEDRLQRTVDRRARRRRRGRAHRRRAERASKWARRPTTPRCSPSSASRSSRRGAARRSPHGSERRP